MSVDPCRPNGYNTGLPAFVCRICCAFTMAVPVYQTNKTKPKFRALKNDENKIKAPKIAGMLLCLFVCLFVCLFFYLYSLWRFNARKSDVLKITV